MPAPPLRVCYAWLRQTPVIFRKRSRLQKVPEFALMQHTPLCGDARKREELLCRSEVCPDGFSLAASSCIDWFDAFHQRCAFPRRRCAADYYGAAETGLRGRRVE